MIQSDIKYFHPIIRPQSQAKFHNMFYYYVHYKEGKDIFIKALKIRSNTNLLINGQIK